MQPLNDTSSKLQDGAQPVFIVGTPRSGTTLTANILGRHSSLFMPAEVHFFEDVYARRETIGPLCQQAARDAAIARTLSLYGRYNQPEDQQRIDQVFSSEAAIAEFRARATDYRSLYSAFMHLQQAHAPKLRWGNNTPKEIFNVEEILEFYPDAKILVCVRDVRDFLLSYKGRSKVTSLSHTDRLRALYHPILTSLLWRSSMQRLSSIANVVSAENLMVVKYEDLVLQPEQTVRSLCGVVGVKYEQQMLGVTTNNSSDVTAKSEGVFQSSVGRWRNELQEEEIFLAQRIAGRQLTQLGYASVRVAPNIAKVIGTIVMLPYAAARALWVNRNHRGPILKYVLVRLRALFGRRKQNDRENLIR